MPSFISKQPKDRDQITIKLDRHVLQNLERYCRYLDSSRDYVINQCLVFIFRKDRQFSEWAATNGPVPHDSPAKMVTKCLPPLVEARMMLSSSAAPSVSRCFTSSALSRNSCRGAEILPF